ncbi:family 16 glycoside hydrolase [Stratiformator vulcanicus]|uniref:3-keto-disaccharide hydrolase domain-containing protein n=1 Tax=Stratiformator vulcanicus TaxID=2527980 RepID=A0A517R0L7_9PLAN|nr:family 16 glycoside hydrolase [Stratiformator vulcanicus]QDT37437.1 hypothetical protein Pan189_18170 [Stratiformator vulcanicus]
MPFTPGLSKFASHFRLLSYGLCGWAILGITQSGFADSPDGTVQAAERSEQTEGADPKEWNDLLDKPSLKKWKVCDVAGGGEITKKPGRLTLGTGVDLTAVRSLEKLPKIDYEVRLKARRVSGSDFFVGLTFPVDKSHCTLILGGWGGGVVGISSLDGYDASENETTSYREFENERWYDVRLRVTSSRITCFLDSKELIDVPIRDKRLSIRREVEVCKPFGLASWVTTAEIKDMKIGRLPGVVDPARKD